MTFTELRKQYPAFVFRDIQAEYSDGRLAVFYTFEIEGLGRFEPYWAFPCAQPDLTDPALRRLLFSLGMAELVSYWKITCSPVVRIGMQMTKEQADWWKRLYFGGLGEFFYRNGIETDFDSFMTIECGDEQQDFGAAKRTARSGRLIPVGGGKDSIVTLNLLKAQLGDAYAYQINHRDISGCIASSVFPVFLLFSFHSPKLIQSRRIKGMPVPERVGIPILVSSVI